jgi:polysaccharide biosynthesis/export protein
MNRFHLLCIITLPILFIQGCSSILEPVMLTDNINDTINFKQEEFNVETIPLTFANAEKANKDLFPRKLMVTGSGARANVIDEAIFLTAKLPKHLVDYNYTLGIGDELSFSIMNEYMDEATKWPSDESIDNYLLGVGDELTFVQFQENIVPPIQVNEQGQIKQRDHDENSLISTNGIIGSNGNILLLGIGNLNVSGKSLEEVRTEVRNILIRNGLTPNFQLEISKFNSKKAFALHPLENLDISINNIPISLREVSLKVGVSKSSQNDYIINLTRDNKRFRFTAKQLFDFASPEIYIRDKDYIEFMGFEGESTTLSAVVGSEGNILLPEVGNLIAVNRTLDELQADIRNILIKKGVKPNFQLEITKVKSKKIYFVTKDVGSVVIPLSNNKTTLKEIVIANNQLGTESAGGLTLVTLKRNTKTYRLPLDDILDSNNKEIVLKGEDQIEIENISYKRGKVYALNGAGNSSMHEIKPSVRETLANILFTENGAFENLAAKRSEVYLLRGRKPTSAYHLDAQNVSRILVAAKMELRPNDIIYIADRSIISFSRLLAEITPLRTLLRDINDGNIP